MQTLSLPSKKTSNINFRLTYLHLTLVQSEGKKIKDIRYSIENEKYQKTVSRCISPYVSVYAALSCNSKIPTAIKYDTLVC